MHPLPSPPAVRNMRSLTPSSTLDHPASGTASSAVATGTTSSGLPDVVLSDRLDQLDNVGLATAFVDQGKFVHVPHFLPPSLTQALIDGMQAARVDMNRNYLPGHKKGGSVSRHTIDNLAPAIATLYRSPTLIAWLEKMAGEKLMPSPDTDPHAYALYFYTEPGDHIGWHYDTSYYKGRRYTVLLGVVDRSSAKLEYKLHTRDTSRQPVDGAIGLDPGALVFFDGDQLSHRISPLGVGEERVSLTFEYVTDPNMGAWQRFISNMKDAVAYFGFRQVFSLRRKK